MSKDIINLVENMKILSSLLETLDNFNRFINRDPETMLKTTHESFLYISISCCLICNICVFSLIKKLFQQ